jgi:hypothetical protein
MNPGGCRTDVTRREVHAGVLSTLAETFVDHRGGERLRDLRAQIDLAAARASEQRLEVIEVDHELRGLVSWEISRDSLDVLLIRATTGRGETTIGRHLLAMVRDQAIVTGVETIRVLGANVPVPSNVASATKASPRLAQPWWHTRSRVTARSRTFGTERRRTDTACPG